MKTKITKNISTNNKSAIWRYQNNTGNHTIKTLIYFRFRTILPLPQIPTLTKILKKYKINLTGIKEIMILKETPFELNVKTSNESTTHNTPKF